MSEVERYWIDPSRLVQEGWHQDDTCVVKGWAYDRAVAERDALQALLTAAGERADVLEAENKRLDLMVSQGDYNYDADRMQFKARIDELDGLLRLLAELPGVRTSGMWQRVVDALKPAEPAPCCEISAGNRALLQAGDYTPEELFGVDGKPSCPKCAKP